MLQVKPNLPDVYFSSGVIYKALGNGDMAEKFWLHALELKPLYWEAIDQITALYNSQHRQNDTAALIRRVIDTSSYQTKLQNNPRDWARYLSLYHTLGDIYCAQSHFYEAALTFTILIAMALSLHPVDASQLGLSAAVDKTQPSSKTTTFLPSLIAEISRAISQPEPSVPSSTEQQEPNSLLLFAITPRNALMCKYRLLAPNGKLPIRANTREWLKYQNDCTLNYTVDQKVLAATSSLDLVVSNALLNLAKIFQDGISSGIPARILYINGVVPTHNDILSLYMFSLSLNPSPSTANNIGILLASLSSQPSHAHNNQKSSSAPAEPLASLSPNNPRELAMQYYNFGLSLDNSNPHIYTNYGSLLRDQGKPKEAILMYQKAVECDPNFNIALTNLASALRDQGQIDQTIHYYRRAVQCSPGFIEAVSGLANAQASVCDWTGRGGFGWEQVSVDANGMLVEGHLEGWVSKVVRIADKQIAEARLWGIGVIDSELKSTNQHTLMTDVECAMGGFHDESKRQHWNSIWKSWSGNKDEGANIVQLIELVTRMCQRRWYIDRLNGSEKPADHYRRPKIPAGLPIPLATTILPFHAFTLPFNASQISQISQRSSVRISMSSLMQNWLPSHVLPPPPVPAPVPNDPIGKLVVGYISSDFLDHPLSHLMQSVFGFHDRTHFHAICYATTPSDGSEYRRKIERDSHEFKDVSGWPTEKVVNQIQADGVHILVNLNGFTRGARNDIFAVRPCPIQVSLIGFAGSLGGGWCDYLLGDVHAIGERTTENWVYRENIMYMPRSFFVCDHRQSTPDSRAQREMRAATNPGRFKSFQELEDAMNNGFFEKSEKPNQNQLLLDDVLCIPGELTWNVEKSLRMVVRDALFPNLPKDAFLMANLNQLYKIDPTIFRVWLNILERLPNAYLWLLQFPKSGEAHLKATALRWTNNPSLVSRILFTPVADKNRHVLRARACDVFLDTPECNAHTTAADVAWTGTPIMTYKRHAHKMCSRIAASVITAALPDTPVGHKMAAELVATSHQAYEDHVVKFGESQQGRDRLTEIRRTLFELRETGDFFDTRQWVRHVEQGFRTAWVDWLKGRTEDIHIGTNPVPLE